MTPLNQDESDVADQVAELIDTAIGPEGRAILARLPMLWSAVAAFGTGIARVQVKGAGLDPNRIHVVTVDAFVRAGMPEDLALEAAWQVLQQEGAPAVSGMIAEGTRVAAQWEETGDETPELLGQYLAQMERFVNDRAE